MTTGRAIHAAHAHEAHHRGRGVHAEHHGQQLAQVAPVGEQPAQADRGDDREHRQRDRARRIGQRAALLGALAHLDGARRRALPAAAAARPRHAGTFVRLPTTSAVHASTSAGQ